MQYQSITGRKPVFRYDDIITAETPIAKQNYFANQQLGLQKQQFDDKMKFEKKMAEEQKQQADTANIISGVSTAIDIIDLFSGFFK